MDEILSYLFAMAISLSGYPAMERPPISAMPVYPMMLTVCEEDETPEACSKQRGLQAAFIQKDHRIVYRDTLDLNDDFDASFIVHEYVHALQYQQKGDALFATCKSTYEAEKEAYAVQQAYIKERGVFAQVGEIMRFWSCPDDTKDAKIVRK